MKSYIIMMFLAVFGAVIGIMGSLGVFPDAGLMLPFDAYNGMSEEQAAAIAAGAMDTGWGVITTMGGTILNTIITTLESVFCVGLLLGSMGVPAAIFIPIQGVIYIVYAWDIVSWLLQKYKVK